METTLGDRIKELRSELTQEALAMILQVDRSTLASWEINRREPDIATLRRIASYFKVSIDWLVGFVAEDSSSSDQGNCIRESIPSYQANRDKRWDKVITLAEQYGLDPDLVCHLLELNVKLTLSLKMDCHPKKKL
jgi:transcriptional regulator with XRE-family HTH domain